MKPLPKILLALTAVAVTSLFSVQPAQAYSVTLEQVGSNVVANGSGPINLTGLTFQGSVSTNGVGVLPLFGIIFTGPTGSVNVSQYAGFTGPTNFGSGGPLNANTGSGDFVGMRGGLGNLFVPQGYVSGAALSDSMTYTGQTFSTLGVTPGTYVWTWGTGANQNFTLQIPTAVVPDSGSTIGLLFLSLIGLFGLNRLRHVQLA